MGFSHKILKFLSYFDAYSSPFKIQFVHKNSFQTTYGGFVSLIVYCILLASFVFLYILLHKKEEQKISTFDLRYNQPAQFVLDIHQDNIKYTTLKSNLSFFFPAFYVQENNKPLNLEEITARFDFDFTYKIRNLSSTETAI